MKKLTALFLSVLMFVSLCVPAGAFGFETVETVTENSASPAESDNTALTSDPLLKPGLNTITGTTAAEDFEAWTSDKPAIISSKSATSRGVGTSPASATGHAADNSLVIGYNKANTTTYPVFYIAARMEKDRKYALAFNMYSDVAEVSSDICLWVMSSNGSKIAVNLTDVFKKSITAKSWYSYNDPALTWNQETGNVLWIQGKAPSNAAPDFHWYLDDLLVMPYYKITYLDTDGSILSVDQVLYDEEGSIVTSYTPASDNYPDGVIGWSTALNATESMTSVELANDDVYLYPVLAPDTYFTYESDIINASTGNSFTVTAADAASWSVDVGTSDATYITDGNTLTVTSQGYAGIVTVTATDTQANEHTHVFRLFSGDKWKPGLNTITGTTEAFGFEGISQEDIFATVDEKSGEALTGKIMNGAGNSSGKYEPHWFLINNPRANDVNGSTTVAYANYRFTYLRQIADYNPRIEVERPINYQFDVLSSGTLYTLVNGAAGSNVYTDSLGSGSTSVWKHENITVNISTSKLAKEGTAFISTGPKNDSPFNNSISGLYCFMDNISYTPYYKITYIGLDGETVAATDYVLYDERGKLMTEYVPDLSKVDGAYGYSLTKDGPRVGSVPLENKDITLYASDATELLFGSKSFAVEGESFTVPTPAEAEVATENFRVWLDRDGNKYRSGDVLSGDALDALIGMSFTAYYQDASVPAMGMAFEAKSAANVNIARFTTNKFTYAELIEDEGRSVLHASAYMFSTAASTDSRVSLVTSKPFDAYEYNIIQYTYKVSTLKDKDLNDIAKAQAKFFYNNGKGNGIWCSSPAADGCTGEHTPVPVYYATATKDYQTLIIDMGLEENNITGHGWTAGGTISELHIDPAKIQVSGVQDTYIDSIRVYRDGIFTVTYDTNAPEYMEDLIQKDVAPETGRGVGTGYLLSDDKPVLESYIFRGWALTPDATPDETITSVDLTDDLTVYAVWSLEPDYPTVQKDVSIRSGADNVNGLRFYAKVTAQTRAFLEEYGFIVALEDTLGENELTFNFKDGKTGKKLYAYGAAYNKTEGFDYQYDLSSTGTVTFSAVCTGIPESGYSKRIVARPYATFLNNGLEFTLYGSSVRYSLKEAAEAIRTAGGEAYEANKEYIDSILGE